MPSSKKLLSLLLISGSLLSLSACGIDSQTPYRHAVADRLSAPAWMMERQIPAHPFELTAFERMHERSLPATLYIEGDGLADLLENTVFFDPSPKNPVALHLAARDKSTNLAYIARPCQYSDMLDEEENCQAEDFHKTMFSEETLAAYNEALDNMKTRYTLTEFNIVGYDSGATLAAILAASRDDVVSLRTVNGEFDINALTPYQYSLSSIPQHHFTGGQDYENKPIEIQSYLQLIGDNSCIETTFIQEATHDEGYVNKWPALLKDKLPQCTETQAHEFIPIAMPEPIYYPSVGREMK